EGISVSTLSVEISKSGSSRSTFSPGFLSHLVNVPSTMLSPIWGITTSVMSILSFQGCKRGALLEHRAIENAFKMAGKNAGDVLEAGADAKLRHGSDWLGEAAGNDVL